MVEAGERVTETVAWRRLPRESIAPPIVETLPYLEVKLEHPDLEATGRREQFFPDAVPYALDGQRRVFYWRPALDPLSAPNPSDWLLACATTHGLAGIGGLPSGVPPLASERSDAVEEEQVHHAVVGGTVAGDATTVEISDYELPTVRIEGCSGDSLSLAVDGRTITLEPGSRRSIELDSRRVTLVEDGRERPIRPRLSVRFPGERTLYHPAPSACYRLFPSFGLDLAVVGSPLAVPTTGGELDHEALAERLGVDLTKRPYPERVLWQAFAHAAFDPHATGTAAIGQLDSAQLVVEPGEESYADRTASSSSS